jgi:streptogramin lyase
MTGAGWITYGTAGSGSGQFDHPYRLAIDSQDRIYIVDADNFRIVRIDDMSGTNWVAYGSQGNGIGQFNAPQGIGIDSLGRIYVTDYLNDRIARFTNMSGAGWTTFGASGSGVGQFESPDDIVFDNSGHMIVSDRGGRIIQTSLMSQTGWIEIPLSTVQSVCLDSSHRIYAVDQDLDRLTRFNSISGGGVVTFGTSGSGVNQFDGPSSVRFGP